jgi:hypothetical protein
MLRVEAAAFDPLTQTELRHTIKLQCLKFLTRFEPYGFAGRNCDFRTGARIPADPRFSRPDVEDSESPQLDSVSLSQSLLHRFKDRLDSHFGFGFGYACPVHDLINDVQLNQETSKHSSIICAVPSNVHDIKEFMQMSNDKVKRRTGPQYAQIFPELAGLPVSLTSNIAGIVQ